MPSEPLDYILNRDEAVARVKPLIDVVSPLLRELVNDGTRVFRRCESTVARIEESGEHAIGPLLLYYHLLEATDGIEILLSNGNANAATPALRSSFEALLQIQYIADSDAKQRGLQWYVCHVHDRIRAIERFNPNTSRGQSLSPVLAEALPDVNMDAFLQSNADDADAEANSLQRLLEAPDIRLIEAEYLGRQRGNGRVTFYSLFGGPANIFELAERTGWRAAYELLYKTWAEVSHARDVRRFYGPTEDGKLGFAPLRDPSQVHQFATFTSVFAVHAKLRLLNIFRPDENITSWYSREIKPLTERLRQLAPQFVQDGRDVELRPTAQSE